MTELPDCWGALKSHRREGRAETPGRLSVRRPATGPPRIPSQNAGHNCGRYWMAAKQWDSSSRPVNSPSTNGTTPQAANQMRSHSRGLLSSLILWMASSQWGQNAIQYVLTAKATDG